MIYPANRVEAARLESERVATGVFYQRFIDYPYILCIKFIYPAVSKFVEKIHISQWTSEQCALWVQRYFFRLQILCVHVCDFLIHFNFELLNIYFIVSYGVGFAAAAAQFRSAGTLWDIKVFGLFILL